MGFIKLMEEACRFFQSHLSSKGKNFLFTKYGLLDATINQARIGYAPSDRTLLTSHLRSLGYDDHEIMSSGLVGTSGDSLWGGRIIFPYINNSRVEYFIGRIIEGVTTDPISGKYVKQLSCSERNPNIVAKEPVFGVDSIRTGDVLIITEGITDAIACHQNGYPAISPVTVRFKSNCLNEVTTAIRSAGKVVIVMDNEETGAGLRGAIDTGMVLSSQGITCFIGEMPRPEEKDKVDLNDFLREGGNLSKVIDESVLTDLHPLTLQKRKEEWKKGIRKMTTGLAHEHRRTSSRKIRKNWENSSITTEEKTEIVKPYLPSLSSLTGIDGGLGPHPVYGSTTGGNLNVNGDRWHCFHAGNQGGGGVLKWIAVYDLGLIKEDEDLRGVDFAKTIQHCWEKYVPDDIKRKYQ
jgi:hypothetical protein